MWKKLTKNENKARRRLKTPILIENVNWPQKYEMVMKKWNQLETENWDEAGSQTLKQLD